MNDDSPGSLPTPRSWRLRATDQVTVATITLIGLALIACSWLYQGGLRGRIIDIEQAEPRSISFQLNINEADWPEWTQLPGVGEELAQRIVQSRTTEGPFRHHADLLRVRGVGPRTLDRLRPYLLPVAETDTAGGQ